MRLSPARIIGWSIAGALGSIAVIAAATACMFVYAFVIAMVRVTFG